LLLVASGAQEQAKKADHDKKYSEDISQQQQRHIGMAERMDTQRKRIKCKADNGKSPPNADPLFAQCVLTPGERAN
jgi:hypothetical protein